MPHRFLRIAVVYLVLGGLLGGAMGFTQDFSLVPVHAHVLLLGWVTLALAGIVYRLYPAAGRTRLAIVHFWIHNLGLPVFMGSLGLMLAGRPAFGPVVGLSGLLVILGLVVFALNVWRHVRAEDRAAA